MKKILLPTDFSDVANNAYTHALHIAKLFDSQILLLHTFEMPIVDNQFYAEDYSNLFESIETAQSSKFKEEIIKLKEIAKTQNCENIKVSYMLKSGDLVFNIKEAVEQNTINLVVMGTSGADTWKQLFLGTNTADVISQINIPVLSIPKNSLYNKYNSIGFTTRFREKDKKALKDVIQLARQINIEVKCLYVETDNSDSIVQTYDDWKQYFKNDPVQFFIIPDNDVEGAITDFIVSQEIDMLAMLTYKRSFFETIFNRSLTKKMAFASDIPILALQE